MWACLFWTAFVEGTPNLLTGDLSISSGVNGMPNVEFLIQSDLSIRVQSEGFLSAKGGSEAGRIVFTAFDPLLPWQGISFLTDDIRNELDFVEVSYAGSDQMGNIVQIANIGVRANSYFVKIVFFRAKHRFLIPISQIFDFAFPNGSAFLLNSYKFHETIEHNKKCEFALI